MNPSASKLYIALIVLIGIAGGYIVYGQWLKPGEEAIPPAPISSPDTLKAFENLKIDFSVLNDAAYNLYVWECAKELAIGQGGTLASGTVQMIEQRLDKENAKVSGTST